MQSTPNFPKNERFLPPDTRTYVCVSGQKTFLFRKIWRALHSCFEIRSFAILPTNVRAMSDYSLS